MEKAVIEKATIKHIELMDYIKSAIDQYHEDQAVTEQDAIEEHADFSEDDMEETAELLKAVLAEDAEESGRLPMRRAA
jgi:hypothetical protein